MQRHHFIPLSYYKHTKSINISRYQLSKIADSDSNNFTVNVLYKDHLLLHYYLWLCSKENWFAYANFNMLSFLTVDLNDLLDADILNSYQLNYETMMRYQVDKYKDKRASGLKAYYNKLSEDEKKQRYKLSLGRRKPRSGYHMSDDQKLKCRNKLLGHPVSINCREKISKYKKENNQIAISKNNQIKYIKKQDLSLYLRQGWKEGFSDCLEKIYIYNNLECLCVDKDKVQGYLEAGYQLGHNHKTSQKLKDYVTIYKDNDEKRIPSDCLEEYIADGWLRGRKFESPRCKEIVQFDLDMNEIHRFKSIKEANLAVGLSEQATAIGLCCRQKQKTCKGYIWRYAKLNIES